MKQKEKGGLLKRVIDLLRKIVYNRVMTKVRTVRIVAESDNPRAQLFKGVIDNLELYNGSKGSISEGDDYNIFFNFSGFGNDKALLLSEFIELRNRGVYVIYDISEERFMETVDADYYILLAATANFVTCSSESIQETLYEQTGRLAYLVADPIDTTSFLPPNESPSAEDPSILWYGEARDIMSVRPFITKNPHNIKIATTVHVSHTKDRADLALILSDKKKENEISKADIIYLPPTSTTEGELRRYNKVVESTILGKPVIAPDLNVDWEGIGINATLTETIEFYKDQYEALIKVTEDRQTLLKDRYSKENTVESIKSALELAPEEPVFTDIDTYISEEFFIH